MNDTTIPKLRRPFRGRRPRRPNDPESIPASGGDAPPSDGGSADGTGAASGFGGEGIPAAGVAAGESPASLGPDGQPLRGPRPERQNRQGPGGRSGPQHRGRKQRHPNDPAAAVGDARGPFDPDAQPRFNDRQQDPNRGRGQGQGGGQGKARFERGQGGQGRGQQGRGGQGGQPKWGGKQTQPPYPGGSSGPERGNEARRIRGGGPQHEEPVRLSKLICDRGLCSQREADAYINRGWVIVNGERVNSVAARVHPAAEVRLAPEARGEQSRGVTILLNKPVATPVLSSPADGESALTLIRSESLDVRYDGPSFHPSHLDALVPAGGLDAESSGLLILTQDSRIVELLGGERASMPVEYLVEVAGKASDESLSALAAPPPAADADAPPAVPARVVRESDNRFRITLVEGRDSALRALCAGVGMTLGSVKRLRIGDVRLGDVPPGKWRYLRDDEGF